MMHSLCCWSNKVQNIACGGGLPIWKDAHYAHGVLQWGWDEELQRLDPAISTHTQLEHALGTGGRTPNGMHGSHPPALRERDP